jgi:hypothetical protein
MAPPKKDPLTPVNLPPHISYEGQLEMAVEAMLDSRINPATGHTYLLNCKSATLLLYMEFGLQL